MSSYTVGIGSVITHSAMKPLGQEGKDIHPPRNRIQVLVGQNHTQLNSPLSRLNAAGTRTAPLIGPFGRS